MLSAFFSLSSKEEYRKYFQEHCLLGKCKPDIVAHHFRQHPVLMLALKGCGGGSWDEMLLNIWFAIRDMIQQHLNDLSEQLEKLKLDFSSVEPPKEQIVVHSLREIMKALYLKYEKRVVVLVDEYDSPLNHAHRQNYYQKASSFFGRFFMLAFKDNCHLNKAFMVGIVDKGAGILSTVNNLRVFSMASEEYSHHFGFSLEEIQNFLQSSDKIADIAEWYNGYNIGPQLMINPWSFLNWACNKRFDSYWVQTAYVESVASVLEPGLKHILSETFSLLFQKGAESRVPVTDE